MSDNNYLDLLERSTFRYVLITFSFSWLLWLPSVLSSFGLFEHIPLYNFLMFIGSFGPFIAGFILTFIDGGSEGVKVLWRRGWRCENKPFLVISFTLIPLLCFVSLILASIIDGMSLNNYVNYYRYGQLFSEILVMFFFGGPFQEEFGWRGYALNSLQSKMNAFESSLILGGIWSIWHYPLFFITDSIYANQSFFNFTISLLSLSIIFTWLHNNTNGSILAAMLFHTSINTTYVLFLQNITPIGSLSFIILLDIVMVAILVIFGQEKLQLTKEKRDFYMNIFKHKHKI
ncbi:MAG: CPBP family intramembrane glutamic endopeptidase [Candidatus Hermodarchaeota archaeon]